MLDRTDTSSHAYLGLLARAKTALASAVEVAVPTSSMRRYPNQPRKHFDEAAIKRLSDSIGASGQTTAGIIRRLPAEGTEYELIDGERRWRAINLIPELARPLYRARLVEADDEVVQYLISGVANFNRAEHTALETCDTIARMSQFGIPMHEIAALLGISVHWGYNIHGLRNLAPEVKAMLAPELVGRQRLPVSAAIEIAKCDPKLHLGLAQRVMRREVSLVGLRAEVVAVSAAAGTPLRAIRQATQDPNYLWRGFRNQAGVALRSARDMRRILGGEKLNPFIATRGAGEVDRVEVHLREAYELIGQCLQRLAQLRAGEDK